MADQLSDVQCGDFGAVVALKKTRVLTAAEKYYLMDEHFVPSNGYVFPRKTYSGCHRSFQASWLTKYNGLVYSVQDDGAYCKYCVLFVANQDARISNYGVLVNSPLTNWQKATTKLKDHFSKKYHALAFEIASRFMDNMSGHARPLSHQLESHRAEAVQQNRKILCSIVDGIITCAKQAVALRGHRDDGDIAINPHLNHGNFLEFLKFRVRVVMSFLEDILNQQQRMQNTPVKPYRMK